MAGLSVRARLLSVCNDRPRSPQAGEHSLSGQAALAVSAKSLVGCRLSRASGTRSPRAASPGSSC